jgi:ubiquinone/menaquinone biosynthesis C-methylase UbiE
MGRQRRNISIDDASSWVYNRMAEVYEARPAYPTALVDALVALAAPIGQRVLDIGAGTGYLALPLAERGLDVVAVEPARAMLECLRRNAEARGVRLRAHHAAAEALPFETPCFDLIVIADALHFLDAELVAAELRRVLVPGGALAIISCELAETPFMHGVREAVDAAADRRPRDVQQAIGHLAALAGVRLAEERHFCDEVPVDAARLERILCSVSFIGPALNPVRFAALQERLRALPGTPVWARTFALRSGRKRPASTQRV